MTGHYLRLNVVNAAHTVPTLLDYLLQVGIRVKRLEILDRPGNQEWNTVLVLTEPTQARVLLGVIAKLENLPTIVGCVKTIRVETLT